MIELEEKLLSKIDENVVTADDNQLFAEGYLRGHISLAAAKCEEQNLTQASDLKAKIEESLIDAKNELSPADQVLVKEVWLALSRHLDA